MLTMKYVDINILDVSAFGVKRWKKAVSQFEVILQPIDEKMASILKPKLNNHLKNPRQVFCFSLDEPCKTLNIPYSKHSNWFL